MLEFVGYSVALMQSNKNNLEIDICHIMFLKRAFFLTYFLFGLLW